MKFDPEAYEMSNDEFCKLSEQEIREEKSIREGERLMDGGWEQRQLDAIDPDYL